MSKPLEYIASVADRLVDQLPHHLRGPKTIALFQAIGRQMQHAEDAAHILRTYLSVQDGYGFLLDIVGSWVKVYREGDTDQDFRARILAQIVADNSGGQREDVLQLLRIIRGSHIKAWHLGGGWLQVNYQMAAAEVVSEAQAAMIINTILDPGAVMLSSYTTRPFGFAGNALAFGFGVGQLGISGKNGG